MKIKLAPVLLIASALFSPAQSEIYLLPNGTIVDTGKGHHHLSNGVVNLRPQDYEWLRKNAGSLPRFDTLEQAKRRSPMFGGSTSSGRAAGAGSAGGSATSGRGYSGPPLVTPGRSGAPECGPGGCR